MRDLDQLVRHARDAVVRRDVADAHVRAVERRPEAHPERARWLAPAIAAFVAVAAAVVIWIARAPAKHTDDAMPAVPTIAVAAADAPAAQAAIPAIPAAPAAPVSQIAGARPVHKPPPRAPELSVKDRWHHARLLRGRGDFDGAIAECLAIADARDATWSPIAELEAVRIYLGPLAQPERAIDLADRAIREWPANALAAEARELRCRARAQLGRACE